MTEVQVSEEQIKKVVAIIDGVKESILAGWQKASQVTGKTDLIAVIEPGENDVSILILPRTSGLALLEEKGCDTKHPSLERLTEAARGLTLEANAIWVVVLYDGHTHLTKMVHQPMSHGGSA
jgi:hypothetical protein